MTEAEQRYAQVEKEALAVTWACEKFADYIIGMKFKLETNHKPLIPLLGSMSLASLPPRIQRFRMRLMRMTYQIVHVPGNDLTTADTLSRAPLPNRLTEDEIKKEEEVKAYVASVIQELPATADRLNTLRVVDISRFPSCLIMDLSLRQQNLVFSQKITISHMSPQVQIILKPMEKSNGLLKP